MDCPPDVSSMTAALRPSGRTTFSWQEAESSPDQTNSRSIWGWGPWTVIPAVVNSRLSPSVVFVPRSASPAKATPPSCMPSGGSSVIPTVMDISSLLPRSLPVLVHYAAILPVAGLRWQGISRPSTGRLHRSALLVCLRRSISGRRPIPISPTLHPPVGIGAAMGLGSDHRGLPAGCPPPLERRERACQGIVRNLSPDGKHLQAGLDAVGPERDRLHLHREAGRSVLHAEGHDQTGLLHAAGTGEVDRRHGGWTGLVVAPRRLVHPQLELRGGRRRRALRVPRIPQQGEVGLLVVVAVHDSGRRLELQRRSCRRG